MRSHHFLSETAIQCHPLCRRLVLVASAGEYDTYKEFGTISARSHFGCLAGSQSRVVIAAQGDNISTESPVMRGSCCSKRNYKVPPLCCQLHSATDSCVFFITAWLIEPCGYEASASEGRSMPRRCFPAYGSDVKSNTLPCLLLTVSSDTNLAGTETSAESPCNHLNAKRQELPIYQERSEKALVKSAAEGIVAKGSCRGEESVPARPLVGGNAGERVLETSCAATRGCY